ncbi:hypothetical protein [Gallibacterium anatis]|uniref:hypothetical protein n=1 Tax=Gallibacterium anatis TaxID=750 RepID=UPI0012D371F7|nr:hypothetical protein [Gallibacterium anatis]
MINVSKENFESMLICSVRYALTRKTYVTLLNIGYIKQHWNELSDSTKEIITKDITEGVELYNTEEFKIDNNSWRECLSWILQRGMNE